MKETRTFQSYNFVTGAVDGTLAYDFGNPRVFPEEQVYERPEPRKRPKLRPVPQEQEWIREDTAERIAESAQAVRNRQGFSPAALLAAAAVTVILVMVLLAQVQLVNISDNAAAMERHISELETERDKLTVEYETIFNLKDVEEYAVGVLGMQEPGEDQIYYLSNVASTDKAVIITHNNTGTLSLGLEDLLSSLRAYFD